MFNEEMSSLKTKQILSASQNLLIFYLVLFIKLKKKKNMTPPLLTPQFHYSFRGMKNK